MDDKVPIVPLEIMGQDINLTRVVLCEGIQPFEKISDTMLAWETNGAIVVFGFGHDQIGYVLFLGLHGLNVKKHVEGWTAVVVVVVVHVFLLLLRFIGSQSLKPRGGPPFGTRTSWTSAFPFLFLFSEFLWGGRFLKETTVGFTVHVLAAGRAHQVSAPMTVNGLASHFQLTVRIATSMRANGGLRAGRQFAGLVFNAMGFVTSVSKKVTMTVLTTSSGFETPWVSMKEIGALFLATGPAMAFCLVHR